MHKKIVLENGLRIILIPRKETAVFTALAIFRVGSRNEDDRIAGMSHFLEHMAYKGSKKRPTVKEVAEFVDGLGGEHNAFTSKEYTGYYIKASSKHLMRALDFLSENISNALIPAEELEKERRVILEEIKMYEDIPQAVASMLFDKAAFGQSYLGREIIGLAKTIKSITREEMLDYKKSHYSHQNAVLAIAGNFKRYNEEKIVEEIEKNFVLKKDTREDKGGQRGDKGGIKIGNRIEIKEKKTEQSNIAVGFIGPGMNNPEWPAAMVLAKILGGGMSSRMFMEVREKMGLTYNIETDLSFYSDIGLFGTYAGVSNNKVYKALEAIIREYQKIAEKDVSEAELLRAKEMLCGRYLIEVEDCEELACGYAIDELLLGKIETVPETIAKYRAVTIKDVLNCARKYLILDKVIFAGVGPEISTSKIKSQISKLHLKT